MYTQKKFLVVIQLLFQLNTHFHQHTVYILETPCIIQVELNTILFA